VRITKEKLNELDLDWINSIINKLPEPEIKKRKIKYIKAMEDYAQKTKSKNISKKSR
jgi:hypothetical protein|tara:strand:- start:37 stop:207 length:171 start_codon:yes stop_codon:yes gene_type:complete